MLYAVQRTLLSTLSYERKFSSTTSVLGFRKAHKYICFRIKVTFDCGHKKPGGDTACVVFLVPPVMSLEKLVERVFLH